MPVKRKPRKESAEPDATISEGAKAEAQGKENSAGQPAGTGASAPAQSEAAKSADKAEDKSADKTEAPKITLEILDSSGKVIRKFPKKKKKQPPAQTTKKISSAMAAPYPIFPPKPASTASSGISATKERLAVPARPALGRRHRRSEGSPWQLSSASDGSRQDLHRAPRNRARSPPQARSPKISPSNST